MDSLFERRLREAMHLARDMKLQYMRSRLEPQDYMHTLGYLEALDRVEAMIDEINARED